GAFLGGGPGAEGLTDRVDVVVDRLGQPDDGEIVAVRLQVGGQIRGGGVGVVAADGVQDGHAVGRQLAGRHLEGGFAFLDEPALHAVLHVGELDAAVLDRAAAVLVEDVGIVP